MKRIFFILLISGFVVEVANGQVMVGGQDTTATRVITTAVPFLGITPDARAAGMGDAGVASSPDANATYWNAAKLVYIEETSGFSLSYTPWLGKIVNDMSIAYLSGYYKLDREQSVSLAMKYFNLGTINFTDNTGGSLGDHIPKEFTFDAGYSRMLTEDLSIGVVLRYINSNLTGTVYNTSTSDVAPGNSVAGDVGVFYKKDILNRGKNGNIAFGAQISNVGGKLTYSDEASKDFLPTNLRLGTTYTTELDPFNSFAFSLDLNKLLVPTPPIYDANGNIIAGKDPNRPMLSGVFGSFTDAPYGFKEEMSEFMVSMGVEYWYNKSFAARAGYFFEEASKGNRKYLTLGLGLRYQVFGLDFAYIVPKEKDLPLAETLRFSILFNFMDTSASDESVTDGQ